MALQQATHASRVGAARSSEHRLLPPGGWLQDTRVQQERGKGWGSQGHDGVGLRQTRQQYVYILWAFAGRMAIDFKHFRHS